MLTIRSQSSNKTMKLALGTGGAFVVLELFLHRYLKRGFETGYLFLGRLLPYALSRNHDEVALQSISS